MTEKSEPESISIVHGLPSMRTVMRILEDLTCRTLLSVYTSFEDLFTICVVSWHVRGEGFCLLVDFIGGVLHLQTFDMCPFLWQKLHSAFLNLQSLRLCEPPQEAQLFQKENPLEEFVS
ncbi:hypothetical protein M514_07972 [Trichuris suis]|nr:hypothetical protein M514_07972 [Trichuris suis]